MRIKTVRFRQYTAYSEKKRNNAFSAEDMYQVGPKSRKQRSFTYKIMKILPQLMKFRQQ